MQSQASAACDLLVQISSCIDLKPRFLSSQLCNEDCNVVVKTSLGLTREQLYTECSIP